MHVTYPEHAELHFIRYNLYKRTGDLKAYQARANLPANAREEKNKSSKRGHETMKKNKIGWFNSDVQRELGKRTGGKKTPAREIGYQKQAAASSKYTSIFQEELLWTFKHNQETISVVSEAGKFTRTGQIKEFLLLNMPVENVVALAIQQDKYFTSNMNKVLRLLIPNPTNQETRSNYKGWSVKYTK